MKAYADKPRQHQILYLGLALLAFAFVVAVLSHRTLSVLNVPGEPREEEWGMQDFRDAIYYPVVSFLDGNNPYHTADHLSRYPVRQHFPLYSPLTLLVHLPFGLLPFEWSELAYFCVTILLYVALAYVALRFSFASTAPWLVIGLAAILLASRPGHKNLIVGQCTVQAVLFSLVALHYAVRKPMLSGVALALAAFKPTFGVPLFLLMLCRRNLRACVIALGLGSVATIAVFGVLATNAGGIHPLLATIESNNETFEAHPGSNPLTSYARVDLFALISRFLGYVPGGLIELTFGLTVMCVGAFAVTALADEEDRGATSLSSLVICLAVLLAVYHQTYDLLLLAPAFVAILGAAAQPWSELGTWPRRVLIFSFTVLAVNYAASATGIRLLKIDGPLWIAVASINGIALLLALAVCCRLALRRTTAELPAATAA